MNQGSNNQERILSELMDTMRDMLEQEEVCEMGLIIITTKSGKFRISITETDTPQNLLLLCEGIYSLMKKDDGDG